MSARTRQPDLLQRVAEIVWLVWIVAMWGLLVYVLLTSPELLDVVWDWVGAQPLILKLLLWLVFLPWMVSLWIWQMSWALWLRLLLIGAIAVSVTVASLPRRRRSR